MKLLGQVCLPLFKTMFLLFKLDLHEDFKTFCMYCFEYFIKSVLATGETIDKICSACFCLETFFLTLSNFLI